jgi:hypothetical protein
MWDGGSRGGGIGGVGCYYRGGINCLSGKVKYC